MVFLILVGDSTLTGDMVKFVCISEEAILLLTLQADFVGLS